MSTSNAVVSADMIHSFLKEHYFGVLSTVRPDKMPDSAAIYYVWHEDALYFLTKREMQKFTNIRYEGHVSLNVTDVKHQTTVKVFGRAFDAGKDSDLLRTLLDRLSAHLGDEMSLPFLKHDEEDATIIKIVPLEIIYRNYHVAKGIYDEGILTY